MVGGDVLLGEYSTKEMVKSIRFDEKSAIKQSKSITNGKAQ